MRKHRCVNCGHVHWWKKRQATRRFDGHSKKTRMVVIHSGECSVRTCKCTAFMFRAV